MPRISKNSRYSFGYITIDHKGHRIPTTVGSLAYESIFGGLRSFRNFPVTLGNIPTGYEHRPDLIADLWLKTPSSWWLICERNNIFDTFEQMNAGDRLNIPVA